MRENTQFWHNKSVFVTGATGLVGSTLINYLLANDADIVCLVRDWIPKSLLFQSGDGKKVKIVRGDVTSQPLLERILTEYEVDTVIHLAAQTIVGIANRHPVSTLETNIAGTWSLLEACRLNPMVKQILIASSDKAYGQQKQLPYDEDAPLQGKHPYDVSKSCADLIAQTYAHTYDLPVAIARCANFYGRGDLNFNRIIPGTIRSIINGENPIIRSDGNYIRDFLYVEDGANAYMLLAEKLAQHPELKGEAFNFSLEIRLTILELVNYILEIMDSNLQPIILDEVNNEIQTQYLSSKKAKDVLQWQPLFDLESGLRKTINWYEQFLKS